MRRITICLIVSAVLALTNLGEAQGPAVKTALKGFDPVDLVAGKEVNGNDKFVAVRGLYRYHFASAENQKRFETDPERFSIQMGGACARMGPLSGLGSPDRYSIHDGRIYIFASDQCRAAFESAPQLFIEKNDAPLAATPEQTKLGTELLAKVINGFGGQAAVDGVKSVRKTIKITYKQNDKDVVGVRTLTMAFPGNFRDEDRWDTSAYGHALTPKGGFRFTLSPGKPDSAFVTEESVTAFMRKDFHRWPFALIKARSEPGFTAVHAGADKIDGKAVEKLAIHLHGALTTLCIDPLNGQVLRVQYRGRLGGNAISDVVHTFGDYRKVEGVMLPFSVQTTLNGKSVANPVEAIESIVVNGPVDQSLFQLPT